MKKQTKRQTKTGSRDQKRKSKLKKRAAAKSRTEKNFVFFTWDKLNELYQATAKEVLINGRTVEGMLKKENVSENLEKSPGGNELVKGFTELTIGLTKELLKIRELHKGRSGDVNMDDPEEMDAVMEIYESYRRISHQAANEYGSCLSTLKQLDDSPALFMTPEEADQFQELEVKLDAMQVKAGMAKTDTDTADGVLSEAPINPEAVEPAETENV